MLHSEDEELLHEARVQSVLEKMPTDTYIEDMAARFKAISEPSRVKILLALSDGELCVDHICEAVGSNQSAVSHQLKALKDKKIVKSRREGKKILYSISDSHIMIMVEMAKEHCSE